MIIYIRRNKILDAENIDNDIKKMVSNQIKTIVLAEA
jgi:preprotein translocase subunit SecA